ncbi:MAG TPA: hypothetical protein VER96_02955 [Polyangiaceae bacterium]|nr:hypothetical protein [Polyangiaceae bacterium]
MKPIACLAVLALVAVGCASRNAPPATMATTTPAQVGHATTPSSQVVELRHFYLLSPGPSSTLVVTRSDTTPGTR